MIQFAGPFYENDKKPLGTIYSAKSGRYPAIETQSCGPSDGAWSRRGSAVGVAKSTFYRWVERGCRVTYLGRIVLGRVGVGCLT